jgi:hypothetical protein
VRVAVDAGGAEVVEKGPEGGVRGSVVGPHGGVEHAGGPVGEGGPVGLQQRRGRRIHAAHGGVGGEKEDAGGRGRSHEKTGETGLSLSKRKSASPQGRRDRACGVWGAAAEKFCPIP